MGVELLVAQNRLGDFRDGEIASFDLNGNLGRLTNVSVDQGQRLIFAFGGCGTCKTKKSSLFARGLKGDFGGLDSKSHGSGALMRLVNFEDMKRGRGHEAVAIRQE